MDEIKVFVRVDAENRIIDINSSAFVSLDWGTEIDQGSGDRYFHAQGNYFYHPTYTEDGVPRYKLVDGKTVERTEEEIAADRTSSQGPYVPTTDERLAALEAAMLSMMGVTANV